MLLVMNNTTDKFALVFMYFVESFPILFLGLQKNYIQKFNDIFETYYSN